MRTCPRCHSSVIGDYEATHGSFVPIWTCLGCGRSGYVDGGRQVAEERLMPQIMRTLREHPGSDAS
jgi:hypothetical protein